MIKVSSLFIINVVFFIEHTEGVTNTVRIRLKVSVDQFYTYTRVIVNLMYRNFHFSEILMLKKKRVKDLTM